MSMKITQLFSVINQFKLGALPDAEVSGITSDSNRVITGSVYVAIPGTKVDGHSYIDQAIAKGAIALVVQDSAWVPANFTGAVATVTNTRSALGTLAAQYYGNPSAALFCVGVTGTNGKTTTTFFVEQILRHFDWSTGVIGTTGHFLNEKSWPTELTTPDAVTLQERLNDFKKNGANAVAFEVSSIALDQRRVEGIAFDAMIFLNFSRDHLDYHKTMEDYFKCKELLFNEYAGRIKNKKILAVINGDDPKVRGVKIDPHVETLTFGQTPNNDFVISILKSDLAGTKFKLKSKHGEHQFNLPIPGVHNVYNASAAGISALHAGVSMATVIKAVGQLKGVPGRWQKVENNKKLHVLVDFAHTPEAMTSLLTEINKLRAKESRIITVFGCGGGRDKGKRPILGKISQESSDSVIVTSDNPRDENPNSIISEIIAGMNPQKPNFAAIEDRRAAINKALMSARPHDIVLIVGKGHEKVQIVGSQKIPFDDYAVAAELLQKL